MLNVHDFVDVIENRLGKPVEDVVKMAKRHNNPKRDFLFVNNLLGKHVSVSGKEALMMHRMLGDEVYKTFSLKGWNDKKILLVGFAETATALAQNLMFYSLRFKEKFPLNIVGYTQTTRENIVSDKFKNIAFEEEHSHATTQKLYFDQNLDYDVVLFVEDEITTGNTILNFIEQFEKQQPGKQYAVASILNWQNDADESKFAEKGVEAAFLVRGKIKENTPQISIAEETARGTTINLYNEKAQYNIQLPLTNNPRLPMSIVDFERYVSHSDDEDKQFSKIIGLKFANKKTLVIGTEENMFLPIYFATIIDADMKATTRSPIEPSAEEGYPIFSRVILNSAYEEGRVTYLYNMDSGDLEHYEQFVVFVEDSSPLFEEEMENLLSPYGEVMFVKQKGFYNNGE